MMIGVCGFKESGKDTVGDYLAENYGFTKRAFATKVKECCAVLLGVDVETLEALKNDGNATIGFGGDQITVREFYQRMGTDVGRNILDPDLWIDLLDKEIGTRESKTVITDVRFQNEIEWIQACGGFVYKIERWETTEDNHISESGISHLTLIDGIIPNNSDLDSLYSLLDLLMHNHGVDKIGR